MRRAERILVAVAAAVLGVIAAAAIASSARAATQPTGSPASSSCLAYPGDYTSVGNGPFNADTSASLAAGGSATIGVTGTGFLVDGESLFLSASSNSAAWVYFDVNDSAGGWQVVASVSLNAANGFSDSITVPNAPAGPYHAYVVNGSVGANVVHTYEGRSQQDAPNIGLLQNVNALCDVSAASASQAHTDAQAIVSDLSANINGDSGLGGSMKALDSDVKALTNANHADLSQLDTDIKQLHTDLTSGGGVGQDVQVTNWPGSQPVSFDQAASAQVDGDANALHSDFWFGIGLLLAAVFVFILWRTVGPRWMG